MNGKILFFIIIVSLIVFSCELIKSDEKEYKEKKEKKEQYARENDLPINVRITRIHGCEYLESGVGYSFDRCHKGDCDNPIHYKNKD